MDTYQRPRYVTGPEQAKMIRAALKADFPGVKFSVRCSRGSAVDISWTDGPTSRSVDAVVSLYKGGGFNGMEDLRYSVKTVLTTDDGAELVQFAQDFVFTHRDVSDEWRNEIFALFSEKIGRTLDPEERGVWNEMVPLAVDRETGRLLRMVEKDTSYLNEVFHQYTGVRTRGMACSHPAQRLYSWTAADGTLCICCCECGEALVGSAAAL